MRPLRSLRPSAVALLAAGALAAPGLAACGSQADSVAGFVADKQAPAVHFDTTVKNAIGDSAVSFAVLASDNLDLAHVHVDVTGGVQMTRDTTPAAATTSFALAMRVPVPASVAAGTPIYVVAHARDGAGNETASDTLRLSAGNVRPPAVTLVAPVSASLFVVGKKGALTLVAASPMRVRAVGYRTSGPFTTADSVIYAGSALADSVVVTDTLAVPANAPAGVLTVQPFVVDGAGRVANGAPVQYAVQTVATSSVAPVATAAFPVRLEVADTLRVSASDPTGVKVIGYEILSRADTTRRFGVDSVVLDGSLVNDARRFTLRLRPDTLTTTADSLPLRVYVRGFATNSGGKRATMALSSNSAAPDTAVVVAGVTSPLPQGGQLADGLYVPHLDRLYLTNLQLNQLEVFDLAGRRFLSPVAVGSQPWGIAAWPRATDGTFGDTLIVANSGGTNVSYVDLTGGGSGREVYRYALPNIVAYSVTTTLNAAGQAVQQRTMYDFSDRPQFLATTCSGSASTGNGCAEPILVYSTTPTGGQSSPFPNAGTIRWENLVRHSSHLFFEQATGLAQGHWDTLLVVRYAAQGVGHDSTLVPYQQPATNALTGAPTTYSVVVDLSKLGFRDTTFVRSSGNFGRAIFGEGGPVLGSRTLLYDAARGLASSVTDVLSNNTYTLSTPVTDLGVSRAFDVSDFIANSYARVSGVAINFDGGLGAVRGDSTYLLDPTLRLQGLLQTSGGPNAGFDFHPRNTGGNSPPGTRYAFSASQLPQIEIYDTYCYQRVRTIPVRDPIVGPIRASVRANGDLVLVGAARSGVIVVPVAQPIRSGCS
ncbi:hypothetical protein tb265_05410 [Gemmatimonadetes bacterium T265]|nr:hypothetical protein tb265_05410 [Gemmatimonadetes bacterium T265]